MKTYLLALLLTVACPTAVLSDEPSKLSESDQAVLMKKAKVFLGAVETGDADIVIRSTHPAMVVKFFDSKQEFETAIREDLESMKATVPIEKTDLGVPTPLYTSGAEEVCFVPFAYITRVDDNHRRSEAFLIAARKKGTNTWLFLESSVLRKGPFLPEGPSLLWEFFPDLPKDILFRLQLPI